MKLVACDRCGNQVPEKVGRFLAHRGYVTVEYTGSIVEGIGSDKLELCLNCGHELEVWLGKFKS